MLYFYTKQKLVFAELMRNKTKITRREGKAEKRQRKGRVSCERNKKAGEGGDK